MAQTLARSLMAMGLLSFIVLGVLADPLLQRLVVLAETRYGDHAVRRVEAWRELILGQSGAEESAKLIAVNDFFNKNVQFKDDADLWGKKDYWATPLETLGEAAGDCEDFSIAKYASLLALDLAPEKLRLVYVKAQRQNNIQAHMVLAYYAKAGAEPLILDNLVEGILPASKRPDLVPVFSFNSAGLWLGNASTPRTNKPESRLSRWRDVLVRMQADGMNQVIKSS